MGVTKDDRVVSLDVDSYDHILRREITLAVDCANYVLVGWWAERGHTSKYMQFFTGVFPGRWCDIHPKRALWTIRFPDGESTKKEFEWAMVNKVQPQGHWIICVIGMLFASGDREGLQALNDSMLNTLSNTCPVDGSKVLDGQHKHKSAMRVLAAGASTGEIISEFDTDDGLLKGQIREQHLKAKMTTVNKEHATYESDTDEDILEDDSVTLDVPSVTSSGGFRVNNQTKRENVERGQTKPAEPFELRSKENMKEKDKTQKRTHDSSGDSADKSKRIRLKNMSDDNDHATEHFQLLPTQRRRMNGGRQTGLNVEGENIDLCEIRVKQEMGEVGQIVSNQWDEQWSLGGRKQASFPFLHPSEIDLAHIKKTGKVVDGEDEYMSGEHKNSGESGKINESIEHANQYKEVDSDSSCGGSSNFSPSNHNLSSSAPNGSASESKSDIEMVQRRKPRKRTGELEHVNIIRHPNDVRVKLEIEDSLSKLDDERLIDMVLAENNLSNSLGKSGSSMVGPDSRRSRVISHLAASQSQPEMATPTSEGSDLTWSRDTPLSAVPMPGINLESATDASSATASSASILHEKVNVVSASVGNTMRMMAKMSKRIGVLEVALKTRFDALEEWQAWMQNRVSVLCQHAGIDDVPPPQPVITLAPQTHDGVPIAEEKTEVPRGLPDALDFVPTVCSTLEEFRVQETLFQCHPTLFDGLVARWGQEEAIYSRRNNRWGTMLRQMLDRILTIDLQAQFNWKGTLGPQSVISKEQFQGTLHAKLLMQSAIIRSRMFPDINCGEAVMKAEIEMQQCINRGNERSLRKSVKVRKIQQISTMGLEAYKAQQHAKRLGTASKRKRQEQQNAQPEEDYNEFGEMNNSDDGEWGYGPYVC